MSSDRPGDGGDYLLDWPESEERRVAGDAAPATLAWQDARGTEHPVAADVSRKRHREPAIPPPETDDAGAAKLRIRVRDGAGATAGRQAEAGSDSDERIAELTALVAELRAEIVRLRERLEGG